MEAVVQEYLLQRVKSRKNPKKRYQPNRCKQLKRPRCRLDRLIYSKKKTIDYKNCGRQKNLIGALQIVLSRDLQSEDEKKLNIFTVS